MKQQQAKTQARHTTAMRRYEGLSIVEFPLPTIKFGPLNIPATGGAYLRLLPLSLQRWGIKRMIRAHRPFVLNFHPWELDSEQPVFPVKTMTKWTHYHNLNRAEMRLSSLLRLERYQTQAEVLNRVGLL